MYSVSLSLLILTIPINADIYLFLIPIKVVHLISKDLLNSPIILHKLLYVVIAISLFSCDDVADGYHFSALSCAACSAFFRRSIADQKTYACVSRNCNVSISEYLISFVITPRVDLWTEIRIIPGDLRDQKCNL